MAAVADARKAHTLAEAQTAHNAAQEAMRPARRIYDRALNWVAAVAGARKARTHAPTLAEAQTAHSAAQETMRGARRIYDQALARQTAIRHSGHDLYQARTRALDLAVRADQSAAAMRRASRAVSDAKNATDADRLASARACLGNASRAHARYLNAVERALKGMRTPTSPPHSR